MFSNFANNNTGIKVAKMIIIPPIVGVPVFSFCPSSPKSLIVSPTCCFNKNRIILLPYIVEINSDKIIASAALKVKKPKSVAPGN